MGKRGFTLVELIVVIAIIAILILLAMPFFKGQMEKAKITQIKHDVKVVEGLLQAKLSKGEVLTDNKVDIKIAEGEDRVTCPNPDCCDGWGISVTIVDDYCSECGQAIHWEVK